MMGSARFARRVLLVVAIFLKHTTALSLGEPGSISVCTNRACRKAGSHDTLRLLRSLASTAARCNMFDDELSVGHTEPDACATESDMTSLISSCGCLGNCGMGPNVHGTKTDEVCHANPHSPLPRPDPVPGLDYVGSCRQHSLL
jgi:NADH:ubiquinone oxidoreductase subunit E